MAGTRSLTSTGIALIAAGSVALVATGVADARIPPQWRNCTTVNKTYPHGIGKPSAHDKTTGVPVTDFKRSAKLYALAIRYNQRLDGDKDGVACEKA